MINKLRIAVLMGGPSDEYEVSLKTGEVVLGALDKSKYRPFRVVISKKGVWPISADSLKADVAFIAMHGTYGEDGTVQGLLEARGIPYTGSGILASALAMDKERSSYLFRQAGLNVPDFAVANRGDKIREDKILKITGMPCVVKPSRCGSSVGVKITGARKDIKSAVRLAHRHDSVAIAQRFINGDEVTCAVLEKDGRNIALPPTQIIPKVAGFFDYRAKYTVGGSDEVTPPRMPEMIIGRIKDTALRAHEILGCRGVSRTDMIVSHGKIFVLETNTIPGMTRTSLLPQAASAAGITFPELLDCLISSAQKKHKNIRPT